MHIVIETTGKYYNAVSVKFKVFLDYNTAKEYCNAAISEEDDSYPQWRRRTIVPTESTFTPDGFCDLIKRKTK